MNIQNKYGLLFILHSILTVNKNFIHNTNKILTFQKLLYKVLHNKEMQNNKFYYKIT